MLERLLSPGGPQSKKLAYLAVIAAGIVWLTVGLWLPISAEWNFAFGLLLAAATGGYVGGKAVAGRRLKVGVEAPPAPGAEVLLGGGTQGADGGVQ